MCIILCALISVACIVPYLLQEPALFLGSVSKCQTYLDNIADVFFDSDLIRQPCRGSKLQEFIIL